MKTQKDIGKRWLGYLLLGLLGLPMLLAYVGLSIEKQKVRRTVKHQMMEQLSLSELTLLKFSTREVSSLLSWEHDREFEYQGQMYDVVKTKILGDTIHYWCWWDYRETRLNRKLESLTLEVFMNHPVKRNQEQQLHVYYQSLFCTSLSPPLKVEWGDLRKQEETPCPTWQDFLRPPPVPPPQNS